MRDYVLNRIERFMRIYEAAGLRFGLDDTGEVTVEIADDRLLPDGTPAPLLRTIESSAALIAALLRERQADLALEVERDDDEDLRAAELDYYQEFLAERAMESWI